MDTNYFKIMIIFLPIVFIVL